MKGTFTIILVIWLFIGMTGCNSLTEPITDGTMMSEVTTDLLELDITSENETTELAEDQSPQNGDMRVPSWQEITNRTSAGRFCRAGSYLYYANIYDEMKLYRYDLSLDVVEIVTDNIFRVQFISQIDGVLYFSARDDDTEMDNIYSYSQNGELVMLVPEATAPLVCDGYLYYHKNTNVFEASVSRMNLKDETVEELIPANYNCSTMTINIADNRLYAANLADVFCFDLVTGKLTNLTNQKFENGVNKLQLHGEYLYFYTYGNDAAIMRMNINGGSPEEVLQFNGGNFWYDVMLVLDDCIVFSGRQNNAKVDGEEFIRGMYVYNFDDGSVKRIGNSRGPTVYFDDGKLYCLMTTEDTGEQKIEVIDLDGNLLTGQFSFN